MMSDHDNLVDSLSEEDAYSLMNDLYNKWGWCGEWFTKQDIALVWPDLWAERGDGGDPPEFDAAAWEAIRSSTIWRTQIRQQMGDEGWSAILDFIEEIQRDLT